MTPEEIISAVGERLPQLADKGTVDKGHAVIPVPLDHLAETLETLKTDPSLDFKMLLDLTVVDWLGRKPRYELVYHLYSVQGNHRIRLKVGLAEGESAPTATHLWPIADWLEREMWDMYGVRFSGHPNLRRLLMYDEFKGHPLRKDYPFRKQQPLVPETWPSKPEQYQMPDLKIYRA